MRRITADAIPTLEQHCERVAAFCFPDSSRKYPESGEEFWLIYDQDQEWIAVIKGGQEIARHNVRLIASLYWL